MTLLLGSFWPGLAGAGLLGLLVGLARRLAGAPLRAAGARRVLAAVVAALAVAGLVPGLPGLWLEGAGLILPPYLAACGLGALVRRFAVRRSRRGQRPRTSPPICGGGWPAQRVGRGAAPKCRRARNP